MNGSALKMFLIIPQHGFYKSRKKHFLVYLSNLRDVATHHQSLDSLVLFNKNLGPVVITKANQIVWFKFGNVHLLDILNSLGETTNIDSLPEAHKSKQTKGFFPSEGYNHPGKTVKAGNCHLPQQNMIMNAEKWSEWMNCTVSTSKKFVVRRCGDVGM